jgi:hypothetical protein
MKFPVNSLLAGNFGFRDRFAPDCLLQRRVCKLPVPEQSTRAADEAVNECVPHLRGCLDRLSLLVEKRLGHDQTILETQHGRQPARLSRRR